MLIKLGAERLKTHVFTNPKRVLVAFVLKFSYLLRLFILQACFASLVSQDYVNGTDQEEIRTGE